MQLVFLWGTIASVWVDVSQPVVEGNRSGWVSVGTRDVAKAGVGQHC